MHNPKLKSAALLMTGAFALIAQGQPAPRPAPAATVPAADEEMIVLTPFEVNTKRDVGYLATNTLAGSRLNTALKDTGAAISVLTPEFLEDLGATSMKDIILFSNNSVPDFGDSAPNFNGNPMLESTEWRLRIRGTVATYARNYFAWESSSDFFNVERIDEARGPNSILFGFGSAGGIVNTTTKQAWLNKNFGSLNLLAGSWNRYRAAVDQNIMLIPKVFSLRVNAVAENGNTWREFEFDRARRAHLATKYQVTKTSSIKAELELGRIHDNVARPWLAIDQTFPWRAAGSPTFNSAQWSAPQSNYVTQTWSEHLVYIDNTKTLADWQSMPFSYSSTQNWSQIAFTPQNLAIIPTNSNLQGPAANRETKYHTYSAFYENQVSDQFSFEIAYNHQTTNFLGYDPTAGTLSRFGYLGDSTELWGDASSILPGGAPNPNAGKFYIEDNWTRRKFHSRADRVRGTTAYEFDAGKFGKHRIAGLYEHAWHTTYRQEDAEVFLGSPFPPGSDAEFDGNRVFRRHYITPGNTGEIRAASWNTPLVNVTDPISGKTLTSGWVPNQLINNADEDQDTFLAALQSRFINERLVTIVGYRFDILDVTQAPTVRDATSHALRLDRSKSATTTFRAPTLTAGAVFHLNDQISLFANTSSNRNIPNLNIRGINQDILPMPKGTGYDFGLKFDLFRSKMYATVDYYTTDIKNSSDYGNVGGYVSTSNRILTALRSANLITAAEQTSHTSNANGYLEERNADGWEIGLVANPKSNWRITGNFSVNNVVKENIMSEVVSWAKSNQAFWLTKAPGTFELGGGSWDTIANQIGWMNDDIKNNYTNFNGRSARGERKYGANIFTRYILDSGALKGLFFGGGARYQSRNIISSESNGDPIYGRTISLVDALVGYEFKPAFLHNSPLEIQLNVTNVFDSDKYQIYTVAYWDHSRPERIGLQEPRKFTLSARISF